MRLCQKRRLSSAADFKTYTAPVLALIARYLVRQTSHWPISTARWRYAAGLLGFAALSLCRKRSHSDTPGTGKIVAEAIFTRGHHKMWLAGPACFSLIQAEIVNRASSLAYSNPLDSKRSDFTGSSSARGAGRFIRFVVCRTS